MLIIGESVCAAGNHQLGAARICVGCLIHHSSGCHGVLIAIHDKHISLIFSCHVKDIHAVDFGIIITTEFHAHHILGITVVGIKTLKLSRSGCRDRQCGIYKNNRLEHIGIYCRGESRNKSSLAAAKKSDALGINEVPRLHSAGYVLDIILLGEYCHVGSGTFALAVVATAAEVEYVTCHTVHGKTLGKSLRLAVTAVVAVGHYDQRLLCLSGVGDVDLSPDILAVTTLAVLFTHREGIVDGSVEVLCLHRIVGEVVNAVFQEHIKLFRLILELPCKPSAGQSRA